MEKKEIPNSQFFAIAHQMLKAGRTIEIKVKGSSMYPFLREGETVVVSPVSSSTPLKKYDIILAETPTGHVMMHRIRKINADGILMKGDGNLHQTELVKFHDVMGKSTHVKRSGIDQSLYSPLQLFLAWLWQATLVRRVGLMFSPRSTF